MTLKSAAIAPIKDTLTQERNRFWLWVLSAAAVSIVVNIAVHADMRPFFVVIPDFRFDSARRTSGMRRMFFIDAGLRATMTGRR